MAIFKARFPSREEIWITLSSILFLVNVWAIINILRAVPSWILSRTIWEMIGIMSYPLAFALLESILFLIGLIILAVVLPRKILRDNFIAMGSLTALLATLGMILAHLYGEDFGIWLVRDFGKYLLLLIGLVLVSWVAVYYFKRLAKTIESVVNRLTPLSTVYLAVDILAVFVILIRNIK
ncbi:MAG: hypothetical protein WA997_05425 [Anaerolineales bacterium]|nr:hypothetical protein [Anaerolineales bacterium]